jgi:hypothetical protein
LVSKWQLADHRPIRPIACQLAPDLHVACRELDGLRQYDAFAGKSPNFEGKFAAASKLVPKDRAEAG